MYHHISKHLKVRQKYSAARRIFNSLLGVWKCDETRSLVFDILHPNSLIVGLPQVSNSNLEGRGVVIHLRRERVRAVRVKCLAKEHKLIIFQPKLIT